MMGGKEKLVALSLRFLFLRVGGLNEMRCVGYAKAKPVPVFAGHRSALCCCFKTNSVSCWNCLFFFCCRWLCIIFEKYIERMSSLLCLHTRHQYGVSPYHRLCFSRRHRLTAYAIAMSTAVCSRLSIFAFRFISFGFFPFWLNFKWHESLKRKARWTYYSAVASFPSTTILLHLRAARLRYLLLAVKCLYRRMWSSVCFGTGHLDVSFRSTYPNENAQCRLKLLLVLAAVRPNSDKCLSF